MHVVPCCVLCCVLLCQNYEYCWVVDPIDGTKEFVKRNGEFTVMIGLIQVRVCVEGGGSSEICMHGQACRLGMPGLIAAASHR